MERLNKHLLEFNATWKYVEDDLNQTNVLSISLLKFLNFNEGHFFTLLPDNANLQELYQFKSAGILPQYPEEEYFISGIRSTYSYIPTIRKELSKLLFNKIKASIHLSCLFDDVTRLRTDQVHRELIDTLGVFYNNEIYYLIRKETASEKLITGCLKDSNSFWHSLCIFTNFDFNNVEKELTLDDIRNICLRTDLILVGAYDSEGYVFWEKNQSDPTKEFFVSN